MENKKKLNPENVLAVYQSPYNGQRIAYMGTFKGGLYKRYLDHRGLFAWGATTDSTRSSVPDKDDIWIKTPQTPYHVWHICFCPECSRWGGRIWTHSQADWDNHLRHVDNGDVFTFPTIGENNNKTERS